MARTGRPSAYDPKVTPILAGWLAREGKIDTEIAEAFEINLATHYRWQHRHPEYREALKKNKRLIDEQVVDSLLKRALGYDYTESENIMGPEGATVKTKRKHMAADVTACIFWLKNRQPEKWRENGDVTGGGPGSMKELAAAIRESRKNETPKPD